MKNSAPGSRNVGLAEEGSACWLTPDRVLLGGTGEQDSVPDPEDVKEIGETRLRAQGIVVYDLVSRKYLKSFVLDEVPGPMMTVGERHAVCFYKHPRLVSLESGEVVTQWDDLETCKHVTSILWDAKPPAIAIDTLNRRFAVCGPESIAVIQIDPSE